MGKCINSTIICTNEITYCEEYASKCQGENVFTCSEKEMQEDEDKCLESYAYCP